MKPKTTKAKKKPRKRRVTDRQLLDRWVNQLVDTYDEFANTADPIGDDTRVDEVVIRGMLSLIRYILEDYNDYARLSASRMMFDTFMTVLSSCSDESVMAEKFRLSQEINPIDPKQAN